MTTETETSHAGYHSFQGEYGPHGSFEVFYDDSDTGPWSDAPRNFDEDGEPVQPGWYWWACFPGCMPDGSPEGPYRTSREAFEAANNGY